MMKRLTGKKSNKKHDIKKLADDNIYTSKKCTAEALKHFITNVAKNFANSLPDSNHEILNVILLNIFN